MTRRTFAGLAGCAAAQAAIVPGYRLIAHRGGVVDPGRGENSADGIREALARGYRMVEADVRCSRDGEPVLYHDATFEKSYGVTRRPEDMSWPEMRALRSKAGGGHPVYFEEACALCAGRCA